MDNPNKPKKSEIQQLGTDVEFTTRELPPETEETRLVRKIGQARTPVNTEYVGTVMLHYFLDTNAIVKTSYDICTLTYIHFEKDISENLAALGLNNAVIQVRKHFNPEFKHKSTNADDKRDKTIIGGE